MKSAHQFTFADAGVEYDVRAVEVEGKPAVLGMDLCLVLGMAKPDKLYARLSPDEMTYAPRTSLGLPPGKPMVVIFESGIYKAVMRSDKPEARRFQDWVTRVVLPSIRKHGGYTDGQETLGNEELLAKALKEDRKFPSGTPAFHCKNLRSHPHSGPPGFPPWGSRSLAGQQIDQPENRECACSHASERGHASKAHLVVSLCDGSAFFAGLLEP